MSSQSGERRRRPRQRERGDAIRYALIAMAVGGLAISLLLLLTPARPLHVELVAATDHSPPFQVILPDGTITGATVEAINLAAQRAGIDLRWRASSARPDDVLADIDSGIDLWPLVTVFPDRKERFYTTQPYGRAEYIIAVIDDDHFSGDKLKLKGYQPGRVAVTRGPWIKKKLDEDLPSAEAVFVDPGQQLGALCDGRADALIADAASLYSMTLEMPRSCAGKVILDRLMEGWYWDLAIASSFARSAEADRIRAEFGHLAREGQLNELFADYPIQAQYRSQDTFAETHTEREARIARAMLVSLCVCSLALFGIVLEARRRATHAMRLVRLKSNLVDRISHELRTPLNGVLGLASLLAATPLNAVQKDYLSLIRQSGEQLLKLVNDSLMLSRLEARHQRRTHELVNIRQQVEDIASLLAPMALDRDVDLVWAVSPRVPASVVADAGVIRQLLINLGGNAMKYTEQGTVALAVTVSGLASGYPFLRYEVDDSGPGIPVEDRARIFDSFVRLERPADQLAVGTGLGLAISKELVVLLGGRIGVEEGKFGGARFWFEFPVELPADSGAAGKPGSETKGIVGEYREVEQTLEVGAGQAIPDILDVAGDQRNPDPDALSALSVAGGESAHRVALLVKVEISTTLSPTTDLKNLAAATKPAFAGRELSTEVGVARQTVPAAIHSPTATTSQDEAEEPSPAMRSETLQMVAQHLVLQGYQCWSAVVSDVNSVSTLPDGLMPSLLVMESPTGKTNLSALIVALRGRYRTPAVPAIVFCRNQARSIPCEAKRPLGARVMRVPFLSRSFDRVLRDAREEMQAWRDSGNDDDAAAADESVTCDQESCPMRSAGTVAGAFSPIQSFDYNAQVHDCTHCSSASSDAEKRQGHSLSGSRVLIADDNPVNRLVLSAMLRGMGVQCDEVADGHDALVACESTRYDLVFLDHHMPRKDGLEVTEALRNESDWRKSVPIIAASAADADVQLVRYRSTAVNAVLAKPFTKDDLAAALEAAGWSGQRVTEVGAQAETGT
jgi:signal transduction histidine kinase/CheY-like chemotaxis protein